MREREAARSASGVLLRTLADQALRHPSAMMPCFQECVQVLERLASGTETTGGAVFIEFSSTAPKGPG